MYPPQGILIRQFGFPRDIIACLIWFHQANLMRSSIALVIPFMLSLASRRAITSWTVIRLQSTVNHLPPALVMSPSITANDCLTGDKRSV